MNSSDFLKNILIITGAGRSGTTILKTVLSNHNSINSFKYEMNDLWRIYKPELTHDRILTGVPNRKAIKNINFFFKTKTLYSKEKFTIEKTVANVMRLKFVSEVLPNSKIIYIERDGRAVAHSASNRWGIKKNNFYYLEKFMELPLQAKINIFNKRIKTLFVNPRRNSLKWGAIWPNFEKDLISSDLIELCAKQWLNSVKFARQDIRKIDKSRLFIVQYEKLILEPNKIINEILNFLNLDSYKNFDSYVKTTFVRSHQNKWKYQLSKEDINKINFIQKDFLRLLGYMK